MPRYNQYQAEEATQHYFGDGSAWERGLGIIIIMNLQLYILWPEQLISNSTGS